MDVHGCQKDVIKPMTKDDVINQKVPLSWIFI